MRRNFKEYVSVDQKKHRATKTLADQKAKGKDLTPIRVSGRKIAESYWGKSWCDNLERYSDFDNRLPRGRTYLRSGAVIDLKISAGSIDAKVMGTRLYRVQIEIAPVSPGHWNALCKDAGGTIDSLAELLQGRFSERLMTRMFESRTGLFPHPDEIRFKCSCPDWASMCKHVAAVLYGVGARLDHDPSLLFTLRQVDTNDLIAGTGRSVPLTSQEIASDRILEENDLAGIFGLDMVEVKNTPQPVPAMKPIPKKPSIPETGRKATQTIAPKRRSSLQAASEVMEGEPRLWINGFRLDELEIPLHGPQDAKQITLISFDQSSFECQQGTNGINIRIPALIATQMFFTGILPANSQDPVRICIASEDCGSYAIASIRYLEAKTPHDHDAIVIRFVPSAPEKRPRGRPRTR